MLFVNGEHAIPWILTDTGRERGSVIPRPGAIDFAMRVIIVSS
jgi:hypothetical protein